MRDERMYQALMAMTELEAAALAMLEPWSGPGKPRAPARVEHEREPYHNPRVGADAPPGHR